jgi:hypothetical protein
MLSTSYVNTHINIYTYIKTNAHIFIPKCLADGTNFDELEVGKYFSDDA